jgi:hypothetical protein
VQVVLAGRERPMESDPELIGMRHVQSRILFEEVPSDIIHALQQVHRLFFARKRVDIPNVVLRAD